MKPKLRLLSTARFSLLLGSSLLAAPPAFAQIDWNGNTDSTWANDSNWDGGTAPSDSLTSSTARFNKASYPFAPDYGSRSVSGLAFGDGTTATAAITLNGTALLIGANGITVNANSGAVTINGTEQIAPDTITILNNSSNSFDIASGIKSRGTSGTTTFTFNGTGTTTISGAVSNGTGTNTVALTKQGAGTHVLSGASDYTAATTVSGGLLRIATGGSLGSGNLNISGGAIVGLAGGTVSRSSGIGTGNNQLQLTSGGGGFAAYGGNRTLSLGSSISWGTTGLTGQTLQLSSADSDATITLSSQISFANGNRTLRVNDGSAEVDAVISGAFTNNPGTFNKTGAGTLALTGANLLTGSVVLNGGSLRIGNAGTTGTLQNITGITLTSGTLAINRTNTFTQATDLNGTVIGGAGNFAQIGSGTTILTAANTYTGTTTISAGTLQIGAGGTTGSLSSSSAIINNATLTFNRGDALTQGTHFSSAGITGTGSIVQAGAGTTTLTAANTYSGATTVSAGNLTVGSTGSIDVGTSTTTGRLTVTGNGTFLVDGGSATFRGNNSTNDIVLGNDTGAGNIIVQNNGSFTLNNGRLIFGGGTTSNASNSGPLSTFTQTGGTTIINSGNTNNVGNVMPATMDISGGTFTTSGNTFFIGTRANTTVTVSGANTVVTLGNLTFGNSAADSSVAPNTSVTVHLNGGTLVVPKILVSGALTNRTHNFNFNGGTLKARSAATDFFSTGANLTANVKASGGTIDNGGFAIAIDQDLLEDPLSTGGGMSFSGGSITTLTGSSTYTGPTTITGGTLALGAVATLSNTSAFTIAAGATLDTTAKTSFAMPAGKTFTFGVNATGSGSAGTLTAQELDITTGTVALDITGPLDDPAYVLATYTSLTGTQFATAPNNIPTGYELKYDYQGNKIALVESTTSATPYETWAGPGVAFGDDANGDGIDNGLAFLLGATTPQANALGLLPTTSQNGGALVLTFQMRNAAARGSAKLNLQHSSDLGIADNWVSVPVPDTTPDPQASDVSFIISAGTLPDTVTVTATIAAGQAANGKLFGRCSATEN